MKELIKYSLIGLLIGLISCTDPEGLLDKAQTGDITADLIYNDIVLADQVLNDLYGRLPNIFVDAGNEMGRYNADDLLDAGTIYGQHQMGWSKCTEFTSGAWGSSNCPLNRNDRINDNIYSRNYESIRACQNFLARIEEVPYDPEYGYGAEEQMEKIAEAKFLLAFYYAELVRFYGGVALITEVIEDLGSDEIKKPRNTYDENIDYIVTLCDEAAADLPMTHADNQFGRATKGAALALKSRMLLAAASPLFNNPDKPEDSPFRGKYDVDKWKEAAKAAADVIQLNQYSLVTDISTMFTTVTNEEVIFSRLQPQANWMTRNALPPGVGRNGGNVGRNQSTYNMMKYYKVLKDGEAYDMTDPASGWDLQNPYANLDPRFYRDYCFNTAKTRNKNVKMWALGEGTTSADAAPNNTTNNNSFLIMIKFADLTINPNITSQRTYHNYQFLRYAEVLLNYAEAMNEAYGSESDVLGIGLTATDAVNLIRRRTTFPNKVEYLGYTGAMPDFPTGLAKAEFRDEVRQERFVELNYEECQFFDLRRWRMPVETQINPQFLVPYLTKDGSGNSAIEYKIEDQVERAFSTAWYLLPIPNDQIMMNSAYVQNPGWLGSPESEN